MTIQSTINISSYYNLEEDNEESDPNSYPKVGTHNSDGSKIKLTDTDTTNINYPRKSLINRLIPDIIPVAIPPIDQTIAKDDIGSGNTLHVRHTIISKDIVTDTAHNEAHVFRTLVDVSQNGTDGTTPQEDNIYIGSTKLSSPVWIGGSTTSSPSRIASQYIISPMGYIGPQWIRESQPLDTSINGIYSKYRDSAPIWSKVICYKFTDKSRSNVNLRCRMNLMHDAVLTKSTNFMNLGLSSVHTSDKFGSVFIPTNIIGTPMDGSN